MKPLLHCNDIHTAAVLGAGQMGLGIAQVLACHAGMNVILYDVSESALEKAQKTIAASLGKFVEKGKLSEAEHKATLSRIQFESHMTDLHRADLMVEAVVENEAVKLDVFRHMDEVLAERAIMASNTSSISITRLAAATKRPDKVIGLHFMNPVPLMQLVEIIPGARTSALTLDLAKQLAVKLQKTPVVSRDFPGFISNRVLMPLINEAAYAVFEGVGSAEDIDTVMKLGMNHPMGPLALADFIGLDTVLSILMVLYEGFNDARYRPCPLFRHYVDAGWTGKKAGRGFYTY
jgi:3-hydroxybutyryl-CoA dehydrogenase